MAATGSSEVPTTDGKLPIIDLNALLQYDASNDESKAAYAAECQKVADALHKFSILIVRDPRVSQDDNNKCVMIVSNSALLRGTATWFLLQVLGPAGRVF